MKTAMFIDGANVNATAKALQLDIDWGQVRAYFNQDGGLLRANYYAAIDEERDENSVVRLLDWLAFNGFNTVTKAGKSYTDAAGARRFKGNVDLEIACDALEMAERVEHIILLSGDGDFCCLVNAIQRKGVKVTVLSTKASQPPMCSESLRRQADVYVDWQAIRNHVERKNREPSAETRGLRVADGP